MKNSLMVAGGGGWIVCPFVNQEFWKCIGCVILAVTYGDKVHDIWSEIPKPFGNKLPNKQRRDVHGNTGLYK